MKNPGGVGKLNPNCSHSSQLEVDEVEEAADHAGMISIMPSGSHAAVALTNWGDHGKVRGVKNDYFTGTFSPPSRGAGPLIGVSHISGVSVCAGPGRRLGGPRAARGAAVPGPRC